MPTRRGDGVSDKSARIEGARAGAPHRTPSLMYQWSSVLIGGRNLTQYSHACLTDETLHSIRMHACLKEEILHLCNPDNSCHHSLPLLPPQFIPNL